MGQIAFGARFKRLGQGDTEPGFIDFTADNLARACIAAVRAAQGGG